MIDVMLPPFSAVGDGIADDQAPIQAAIDAAVAAGGETIVLGHTHALGSQLHWSGKNGIHLVGRGFGHVKASTSIYHRGGTQLRALASLNGKIMFRIGGKDGAGVDAVTYGSSIRDVVLDGCEYAFAGIQLQKQAVHCLLSDVHVANVRNGVILKESSYSNRLRNVTVFDFTETGFLLENRNHNTHLVDCFAQTQDVAGQYGFRVGKDWNCGGVTFTGCGSQVKNAFAQVWIENASGVTWTGGYVEVGDLGGGQGGNCGFRVGGDSSRASGVLLAGFYINGSFCQKPIRAQAVDGLTILAGEANYFPVSTTHLVYSESVTEGRLIGGYYPGLLAVDNPAGWQVL